MSVQFLYFETASFCFKRLYVLTRTLLHFAWSTFAFCLKRPCIYVLTCLCLSANALVFFRVARECPTRSPSDFFYTLRCAYLCPEACSLARQSVFSFSLCGSRKQGVFLSGRFYSLRASSGILLYMILFFYIFYLHHKMLWMSWLWWR